MRIFSEEEQMVQYSITQLKMKNGKLCEKFS